MSITEGFAGHEDAVAAVFGRAFAASEGAEEGRAIEALVLRLLAGEGSESPIVLVAQGDVPIGAICFTPMWFGGDARSVLLLSPVAVIPEWAGRGIGTRLIAHGLRTLAARGADMVVTYGDPAFYGRLGFVPVPIDVVPAPFDLSRPEGWQVWRPDGQDVAPLPGPARCVPAFQDPALW
jgi:predicted N-acetyltransferase YhbS